MNKQTHVLFADPIREADDRDARRGIIGLASAALATVAIGGGVALLSDRAINPVTLVAGWCVGFGSAIALIGLILLFPLLIMAVGFADDEDSVTFSLRSAPLTICGGAILCIVGVELHPAALGWLIGTPVGVGTIIPAGVVVAWVTGARRRAARTCRVCGRTGPEPDDTCLRPAQWQITYVDNTGICPNCPAPHEFSNATACL